MVAGGKERLIDAATAALGDRVQVRDVRIETGCNRYFVSVEAGDRPGDLQLGPSGSTRMICPEAIMAIEQRFLHQLNGATTFSFMAGQLIVSFSMDGKRGAMHFAREDGRP